MLEIFYINYIAYTELNIIRIWHQSEGPNVHAR